MLSVQFGPVHFYLISLSCFLLGWALLMLPLLDRFFAKLGMVPYIAGIVLVSLGLVILLCGLVILLRRFVIWLIRKLRQKKK